ncbi:MAG: hypothetical protein ACYTFG_13940 [Planctomycetota bacterium]
MRHAAIFCMLCLAGLFAGCPGESDETEPVSSAPPKSTKAEPDGVYEEELARLRREAPPRPDSSDDIRERSARLAREMEAMQKKYDDMAKRNADMEKEIEKVSGEIRDMEDKLDKK